MSEVYPAKGLFDDVLPGLPGRPLAKHSKRRGGVARLQAAILASGSLGALAKASADDRCGKEGDEANDCPPD